MGEKHLAQTDISNLVPCKLFGKSIIVPTTAFVRPHTLDRYVARQAALGIVVQTPKGITVNPVSVLPEPPIDRYVRKTSSRPVICLNDGRFFHTVLSAGKHYRLSSQSIGYCAREVTHQAKGYKFRYATPEEIERYDKDPAGWQYEGELVKILSDGKRK